MVAAARPVAGSVDELLAGATVREQLSAADGKSGALLERVVVGREPLVLKRLSVDHDWIARATGDLAHRPVLLWRLGLLDALPRCLDHAVVACAQDPPRGAALLMRDVSPWLVPEGDDVLAFDQHRRFLDHMAALHAAFWNWRDMVGLLPLDARLIAMSPAVAAAERAYGGTHPVPTELIPEGWRRLPAAAPRAGRPVLDLVRDPAPLVKAMAKTPATLVHGDWKCGNLGSASDDRTIILDWAWTGEAPPCLDLTWYLAINAARLPESKEEAMDAYRRALERQGVDTVGWFRRQLDLCLVGTFMMLGWEKTFGDPAELRWWDERVGAAAARWLA